MAQSEEEVLQMLRRKEEDGSGGESGKGAEGEGKGGACFARKSRCCSKSDIVASDFWRLESAMPLSCEERKVSLACCQAVASAKSPSLADLVCRIISSSNFLRCIASINLFGGWDLTLRFSSKVLRGKPFLSGPTR